MYSCTKIGKNSSKLQQFIRHKHAPDHWSVLRKKVHPVDKALNHFDDFYKQVFTKKWGSIREGLLGKQKYMAIVNNYADDKETMRNFELMGALNVRTLFKLEKQYLIEDFEANKRLKALKRIRKLADESEISDKSAEEKDKEPAAVNMSLKQSLEKAEIDVNRIVDGNNVEILSEFIPAAKIKGMEDFISETDHYKFYDTTSNFNVNIEREYDIHFPENLNIYCYEMENTTDFEAAKLGSTGVLNYYLMDGGSVLPVLALGLKPGNIFLDVCASPGGKSLLALQTLYPDCVISNDSSHSRVARIEHVYKQFLYDFEERWLKSGKVRLMQKDGRFIPKDDYDRILVDVPCTNDRHSLHNNDNNMFKPSRIKERLQLPQLQCEILVHALTLIKKGGIVVYSTCSLSPIQNDGVVYMALKRIWEETKIDIVVKDLSPALLQTKNVYKLADQDLLKFGHLVLPNSAQNYGPTYFCKMQRIK